MGIPRGTARLLLDEAKARPFSGRALLLGRGSIYFGRDELERWAREQGVALASGIATELSHDPALAATGCLADRTLFRLLGFDEVATLDVSAWEGAEIVHDLNLPVPEDLAGRFDAVFEAGTLQHVFDLPRALANVHRLLRSGGRAIHGMAPSTNHVDHGFWMFSPTLFHDFYTANGWRIEGEFFCEFVAAWAAGRFVSKPWTIYRYEPGCLDPLAYGGFGARQLALFVVATKSPGATGDRVPQQSWFARHLGAAPVPQAGGRPQRTLEQRLAATPALFAALVGWKRLRGALLRRLPRRMPPVHRRY
jgi:SAM-dependent methyltransferase